MLWIPFCAWSQKHYTPTEDTRLIYWGYIKLLVNAKSAIQADLEDLSFVICVTFPFLFILFYVTIEVYHSLCGIYQ